MDHLIPSEISGYGWVRLYDDNDRKARCLARDPSSKKPVRRKQLNDLDAVFDAYEISDGAVLSFHHHFRDGDAVLNMVIDIAAQRGLSDLTIAVSSIFPTHAPLVQHIRSGVIGGIWAGYIKGPVGDEVVGGGLRRPAILQSHGGRARAISSGQLNIDVAFIAAPRCDVFGNLTGAAGRAACGPLGYAMVDADFAHRVVAISEEISDEPLVQYDIAADRVDNVVKVPYIGDQSKIISGATRISSDPASLQIATLASNAIYASGALVEDFSFQTGAGGISLAVTQEIKKQMRQHGIQGSFLSGGITRAHVDLVTVGLFREIIDVQCFDLAAVESYGRDQWHRAMSAAEYASPLHPSAIVDQLSVVILGAAEIDRNFNVNVTVGGDGSLIGGPGGHPDTAAGSHLTVITTRLVGGGFAKIVERVRSITTPGCDIDLLVTEMGIAVNPRRIDLKDRLVGKGLPVVEIGTMIDAARDQAIRAAHSLSCEEIAAFVEYRDGSIIDGIHRKRD